ncbi:MAG: SDR family NAD(P)-dependent oxidoreductase, partial [Caldilineaceae bacterium]|nr:SDR family NAD(P)-dependent oxidoreductase [Caldilineaceae bacterium]
MTELAKRFTNQVVIVTGAAQGIGQAIAERFGAEGAGVVVCDRNGAGAATVAAAIQDAGHGKALAITADIADEAQVDALFEQTLAHFGTVDVLVNNA